MPKILDFTPVWWGYTTAPSQPYPCVELINLIMGRNGSGKTTLMDGLKACLGDPTFESNRALGNYIHPDSNWSVFRIALSNTHEEGKPFAAAGYYQDEVTVCFRVYKERGATRSQYYLFDGRFTDVLDLGQHPQNYRQRAVTHSRYREILDLVGMGENYRKFMYLSPDDVWDIISMDGTQLLQKVVQLRGLGEIQERYENSRDELRRAQEEERDLENQFHRAERELREREEERDQWEQHQKNILRHEELKRLLQQKRYWDAHMDAKNLNDQFQQEVNNLADVNQQIETCEARLKAIQEDYNEAHNEKHALEMKRDETLSRRDALRDKRTILEQDRTRIAQEIAEIQAIPEEDLEALTLAYQRAEEEHQNDTHRQRELQRQINEARHTLHELRSGQPSLPWWVAEFLTNLQQARIQHHILCDLISVKPEYEAWLRAIEGLLGRERFRIIVDPEQYLQAKQIQEASQYRARVSTPRRSHSSSGSSNSPFPSLLEALEIEHPELIGGYLERFRNVYLVETVEQGHHLQLQGLTSLTQHGLLQDHDGALFCIPPRLDLVCGRLSRQHRIQDLENDIRRLQEELEKAEEAEIKSRNRLEHARRRLEQQQLRASLPEKQAKLDELQKQWEHANHEVEQITREYAQLQHAVEAAISRFNDLKHERDGAANALNQNKARRENIQHRLQELQKQIPDAEYKREKYLQDLQDIGFSDAEISQLDELVENGLFIREDETEWTQGALEHHITRLDNAIRKFEEEYPNLNETVLRMVEHQRHILDNLRQRLDEQIQAREEAVRIVEQAEVEMRNNVREVARNYLQDLEQFVQSFGARTTGRLEETDGPPEQWSLNIKIGFDNKEPVPYSHPSLSSGQRVAASIILLIAALRDPLRNDQANVILLDEPTARLDDIRIEELGELLRNTGIQFFVTQPLRFDVDRMAWADQIMALHTLQEGQRFAPNPQIIRRRHHQKDGVA